MKADRRRMGEGSAFAAGPRRRESGQASILLLSILGTFLLASVAFAVDMGNLWFHRQATQTAADAACAAGAMDMLYKSQGTSLPAMGFTAGTAGKCSVGPGGAICSYAGFNGYTATTGGLSATAASKDVLFTFPAANSVSGVTGAGSVTYPLLKVVVEENVQTWFMGLVGKKFQVVAAACTCGVTGSPAPPALLVLNPTIAEALYLSGGGSVVITGGPQISIQVNSSANGSPSANASSNAVYCQSGGTDLLDTTAAGPTSNGGNLDVVGGPGANQGCGSGNILNGGAKGVWKSGAAAIADPYSAVPAPTQPTGKVLESVTPVATVAQGYSPTVDATYGYVYGTWVASGTDSCPNTAAKQHYLTYSSTYPYNSGDIYGNCLEFTPGYYPNGIDTTTAENSGDVVMFMPGVYYLNGNLNVNGSTILRNAWVGGQPSTSGVFFYFLTGGPVMAGSTGTAVSTVSAVPSDYLNCSGTATPAGMPSSLNGSVLVSQCTAEGTYVGAPSTDNYSSSGNRGLLFFLAHSDSFKTAMFAGSATLNFSGSLYFHNSSYADILILNGAGTSETYSMGNFVVDQLQLSGSGTILIGLPPSTSSGTLSAGLFK